MKNFLVYIWHFAVVIAVSTGGGAELLRGVADMLTRTSRAKCEAQNWVSINYGSISVCISGKEIVYRPQTVLSLNLPIAGEETVELAASTLGECAQLAAEAGLAVFESNSKCLAYSSSNRFMKCYIFCNRVIFVTSHSFPNIPRLVSFDEAPWKPGPYDDTREYRLKKLIYLDESNMTEPYGAGVPYDPKRYRVGYSYTTLQNGSTLAFSNVHVDLSTCLFYDGDAGWPTLVSPIYFNSTLVIFHFMESCGDTIKLPPSSTAGDLNKVPSIIVYSHRGYGCSEFPGKTYVDCTVNIELDDGYSGLLSSHELNGPDGDCDGFTFTEDTKNANENFCGIPQGLLSGESYTFTLRGSASDTRLGFLFVIKYDE